MFELNIGETKSFQRLIFVLHFQLMTICSDAGACCLLLIMGRMLTNCIHYNLVVIFIKGMQGMKLKARQLRRPATNCSLPTEQAAHALAGGNFLNMTEGSSNLHFLISAGPRPLEPAPRHPISASEAPNGYCCDASVTISVKEEQQRLRVDAQLVGVARATNRVKNRLPALKLSSKNNEIDSEWRAELEIAGASVFNSSRLTMLTPPHTIIDSLIPSASICVQWSVALPQNVVLPPSFSGALFKYSYFLLLKIATIEHRDNSSSSLANSVNNERVSDQAPVWLRVPFRIEQDFPPANLPMNVQSARMATQLGNSRIEITPIASHFESASVGLIPTPEKVGPLSSSLPVVMTVRGDGYPLCRLWFSPGPDTSRWATSLERESCIIVCPATQFNLPLRFLFEFSEPNPQGLVLHQIDAYLQKNEAWAPAEGQGQTLTTIEAEEHIALGESLAERVGLELPMRSTAMQSFDYPADSFSLSYSVLFSFTISSPSSSTSPSRKLDLELKVVTVASKPDLVSQV